MNTEYKKVIAKFFRLLDREAKKYNDAPLDYEINPRTAKALYDNAWQLNSNEHMMSLFVERVLNSVDYCDSKKLTEVDWEPMLDFIEERAAELFDDDDDDDDVKVDYKSENGGWFMTFEQREAADSRLEEARKERIKRKEEENQDRREMLAVVENWENFCKDIAKEAETKAFEAGKKARNTALSTKETNENARIALERAFSAMDAIKGFEPMKRDIRSQPITVARERFQTLNEICGRVFELVCEAESYATAETEGSHEH